MHYKEKEKQNNKICFPKTDLNSFVGITDQFGVTSLILGIRLRKSVQLKKRFYDFVYETDLAVLDAAHQ